MNALSFICDFENILLSLILKFCSLNSFKFFSVNIASKNWIQRLLINSINFILCSILLLFTLFISKFISHCCDKYINKSLKKKLNSFSCFRHTAKKFSKIFGESRTTNKFFKYLYINFKSFFLLLMKSIDSFLFSLIFKSFSKSLIIFLSSSHENKEYWKSSSFIFFNLSKYISKKILLLSSKEKIRNLFINLEYLFIVSFVKFSNK